MQHVMQVLRQLNRYRVGVLAGLIVLMLTAGTAAVAMYTFTSDEQVNGERDILTAPATERLMTQDELATPPPTPNPAPAEGQASAPVEPGQPDPLEPPALEGASEAPEFERVRVQQPRLRVSGLTGPGALREIRRLDGVRFATQFEVSRIPVGDKQMPVTVAAVDPEEFRKVTPQVTADAVAVWQRIVEGDAAFTHDIGNRLKMEQQAELGSFVPAGTEGYALRVGAYASNGIPPVADALISPQTAHELGLQTRSDALVTLKAGAEPEAVAARIRRITGADVDIIEEPQQRRAFLTGADARSRFEPFNYVDMGDGMIQIDPEWVRRNIVRRPMPLLKGEVVCHRLMVDQLYGALKEIEERGWGHLIDPSQYGGCWVPRHIDFNPAKPLSMHAWGLAADFNVSTNGLGKKPQMDPRVVQVFDRWGFVWGGRWSRPDGMHFELGALIQNSPRG